MKTFEGADVPQLSKYANEVILTSRMHLWPLKYFFSEFVLFSTAQHPNSGLGRLIVIVSRSRTHIRQYPSERVICSSLRPLSTQRATNLRDELCDLSGIQTHDTSNQATSDQRFIPHGHRDWFLLNYSEESPQTKTFEDETTRDSRNVGNQTHKDTVLRPKTT